MMYIMYIYIYIYIFVYAHTCIHTSKACLARLSATPVPTLPLFRLGGSHQDL